MAKIFRKIDLKKTIESIELGESIAIPWSEACSNSIRTAVCRKGKGAYTVRDDKGKQSTIIRRTL